MRNYLIGLAAAVAAASPATATTVLSCSNSNITPVASACFTTGGNVLNAANASNVSSLLLTNFGFTWSGGFNAAFKLDTLPSSSQVNFTQNLIGTTIVGVHFGGSSPLGNSTAFYRFNAGTGLDIIGLNITPGSDAYLFSTQAIASPQPEPATWAMLVLGFGLTGAAMRGRAGRRVAVVTA